jgi:hypothetical protein
MSAVVTKKLGGDYATQLTFPAVFEAQAKMSNLASQFYPEVQGRSMELLVGSGLQQNYHEQKRLDANRRCLNGVRDNAASMARYLSSHANYIMPKPVLSQRVYANPSNGNQSDIYSSRPQSGLSGGVLRTIEGQKWGRDKLKERIPQLDAIKAAKDAFLLGTPLLSSAEGTVGIADITAKVELYGLLNRIANDVEVGVVNTKTVENSQSALKLLFSWTPYGELREIEEVMEKIEEIKNALTSILEEDDEGVAITVAGQALISNAGYLENLFNKMREYLVRMNGVLNRSRKEREKASSIFIKSLGFSELEKKLPRISAKIRRELAEAERANPNAHPEGESESDIEVGIPSDSESEASFGGPRGPPPPPPSGGPSGGPSEPFYADSGLPFSAATAREPESLSSFPHIGFSLSLSDEQRREYERQREINYRAMLDQQIRAARGDFGEPSYAEASGLSSFEPTFLSPTLYSARAESKEDDEPTFDVDQRNVRAEREAIEGRKATLESAELPTEERVEVAPDFEPAVAAAAAAAPSAPPSPKPKIAPLRPIKKVGMMRQQTAEEVLTPEELGQYQQYKEMAKSYPSWLKYDTWKDKKGMTEAEKVAEDAKRKEAVTAAINGRNFSTSSTTDADKEQRLKRKYSGALAILAGIKRLENKIAAAGMVPMVKVPKRAPIVADDGKE